MRKSNIWWLVFIILVVAVALFLALNIEHPAWVENLLFWRPVGQRDIGLRQGFDLQGGLQITLAADVVEEQELETETMEEVRRVLKDRAGMLELTEPVVKIQGGNRIVVQLPGIRERRWMTETYQTPGLVEFVNAGYQDPALLIGTLVETTLGGPPMEEAEPLIPVVPLTPDTEDDTTGQVLETVLSNKDLVYIAPRRTGEDEYTIDFALAEEAVAGFTSFTSAHAGQFLCVALDKMVLSCATLPSSPLQGGGGIPARLMDEEAARLSAIMLSGQLPVTLSVEGVETMPPSLGEATVQQGGRLVLIGLFAVFLFLLFNYRLPGLLVSLALAVFGLFGLALCKVVPLPVMVPGIVGFATAALLALSVQLAVLERLREKLRVGQLTAKAVENCFSNAWPSVRAAHIALLIFSIAMWYLGDVFTAGTVHWMGVTLTVGALISLFNTAVVVRVFVHLVLDRAQEWPDGRKWLLGI